MGFLAGGISTPLVPKPGDFGLLLSPGFAVSLVFVSYAYTGWNAAVYIVGDLKRPERLARALVAGTLLVTVLYFLVNFVILRAVPLDELAGRIEIGYLAAERILGATGGRVMAAVLGLVLASTVSAMVFLGPRVVRAMGEDEPFLRPLGRVGAGGVPHRALLLQLAITLVLLYSGTFEQILLYAGFTLNLMTAAAVAGVFRLRAGKIPDAVPAVSGPRSIRSSPLFFLGWTLTRFSNSLLGLATAIPLFPSGFPRNQLRWTRFGYTPFSNAAGRLEWPSARARYREHEHTPPGGAGTHVLTVIRWFRAPARADRSGRQREHRA